MSVRKIYPQANAQGVKWQQCLRKMALRLMYVSVSVNPLRLITLVYNVYCHLREIRGFPFLLKLVGALDDG